MQQDKTETILSFTKAEKIIIIILPMLLGATLGWFIPVIADLILKLPIVPLEKIFVFISSLNGFWVSVVAMAVGVIIGLLFTTIAFSENLKVTITDSNLRLIKEKDNTNIVIEKQDISAIYIEDKTLIVLGLEGEELYRGKFDRDLDKARDSFLYHHYPWSDKDPFIHKYQMWDLKNESLDKKMNSILYSRRVALRDGKKKEAEHLRKDLSELGIVIRDQDHEQYFRRVKK